MKVRLSNEAITKLRHEHEKYREIKLGLGVPLGIKAISSIYVAVKVNEWNGPLTKEAVLLYLEGKLNMKRSDLLEIVDDTI